ncbi:phosphotransferase family protein [Streptomyces sp. NPDC052092]|uniref:phosphotransferase family protein n=1 Tax=Streptomyces sp. NPDC052092 TaxID=3365685 RepID=UPI0037CEC381
MPRVLAADFSHEILGRDYMVQSLLDGIPATEHLRTYPRSAWLAYYRQLGEIARRVHDVRGPAFGPIAGPAYGSWSEAVAASLEDIAADMEGIGLDASDLRKVITSAHHHHAVLDEITEPRMLTGDLWLPNTQLDHYAPEPVIIGTYDFDRTWWGDPAADWTIRMITAKSDERTAFWVTYGPLDQSEDALWRSQIYEARHPGAIRLERHRLGNREGVRASYDSMADILASMG